MNISGIVGTLHVFPAVKFACVRTPKEGCPNKRKNGTLKEPGICATCRSIKLLSIGQAKKGA